VKRCEWWKKAAKLEVWSILLAAKLTERALPGVTAGDFLNLQDRGTQVAFVAIHAHVYFVVTLVSFACGEEIRRGRMN